MASALAARWTALYVLFPVFQVREDEHGGVTGDGAGGSLRSGHFGIDGRVILDGAIKEELREPVHAQAWSLR